MAVGGDGSEAAEAASRWGRVEPVLALVVLLTPVAVALGAWVGHRWAITGDWAAMDLRIGQVGTDQTPLFGAYSTRGWAHPGPAIYWLAAPLHWLAHGDPRSMLLTAGIINAVAIGGTWWIVRRRIGAGAALWFTAVLALTIHGLRPARIIDIWNPLVPLLPLMALAFVTWMVALGDRRKATGAIVLASLIGQAHVGMIPLIALLGAWAVGWVALARFLPDGRSGGGDLGASADDPLPGWARPIGLGLLLGAVLWIPALVDQAIGTGNLRRVLDYFADGGTPTIGLGRSTGLMSTYLGPHSPIVGIREPIQYSHVLGSGVLTAGLVLIALASLSILCARRGDRPTTAGTTLALVLVAGAIVIGAKVDDPVFDYLVKWMAIVSAFAWFWIGWATWTLVRGRVGRVAAIAFRVAVWGALIVATVLSVPDALRLHVPGPLELPAVESVSRQLAEILPNDQPVRLEQQGDDYGNVLSGIVYRLRQEGIDAVTSDGWEGQKYGPDAVWEPGDEPADQVYTVAVDFPEQYVSPRQDCAAHGARPVAAYDELSPAQRRRMDELARTRLFHPDRLTPSEQREGRSLSKRAFAVTVFEGSKVCTTKQ